MNKITAAMFAVVLTACGKLGRPSSEASRTGTAGPGQAWLDYANAADMGQARTLVEPKFFGSFYTSLPPRSDLVRALGVDSETTVGDYAKVDLSFTQSGQTWRGWFAFHRTDGKWRLTLDEAPILNSLTPGWPTDQIGQIKFHSSSPLSDAYRTQAHSLDAGYEGLRAKFGYSPGVVDFFVAENESESVLLGVGETSQGAGTARYHLAKAMQTAYHLHELVHVFAMEIGAVNPFIDEGLATALGNDDLITSHDECQAVQALLANGFSPLLDASKFRAWQREGRKVYAAAQYVMLHWIGKYSLNAIKVLLHSGVDAPGQLEEQISRILEPASITDQEVGSKLSAKCNTF